MITSTTSILVPYSRTTMRVLLILSLAHLTLALWPVPRNLKTGTNLVKLSSSFEISVSLPAEAPRDLLSAIQRTKDHLANDKHRRLTPTRGEEDRSALPSTPTLALLELSIPASAGRVASIAEKAVKDISRRDEAYSLHLPADGSLARISANSTLGLLRGLTTFEQLWYWIPDTVYAHEAPVVIENDAPAFPYRGFMLDTARNFFPVEDIKRTLSAMSLVKMSVFHWHIVDAQSFPLYVPSIPSLSEQGAYSPEEVYSEKDVQDIVQYAAERGIDVVIEIDTPGHTAAIAHSHPAHIACPGSHPWPLYAAEPPSGQLRLASPATLNFTLTLLTDVARRLPGTMFSTGGDEVNMRCYAEDAETQRELGERGVGLDLALAEFVARTHEALKAEGKRAVVWQEMALEHNIPLANDTVVMVWISSRHAERVAKKGFHIVHAPNDYFYLDCGGGQWIGDSASSNSWCDPFKSWQKAYTFDPLARISASEKDLILGGQQLLWAEQASPENLDSIVWPRAAVSAEVFWTGARLPSGEFRNVKEALPRLHDLRYRMVKRGVRAIVLQPHWCALRKGECDSAYAQALAAGSFVQRLRLLKDWLSRVFELAWDVFGNRPGFTEL